MQVHQIPVSQIARPTDVPRSAYASVLRSIRTVGLLHPVLVRRTGRGSYQVVAGRKRFLACAELGWELIPCLVVGPEVAELAKIAENGYHRRDYVSQASAVAELLSQGLSDRDVAQLMGCSRVQVYRLAVLASLPQEIRRALAERRITMTAAWQCRHVGSQDLREIVERLRAGGRVSTEEVLRRRRRAVGGNGESRRADAFVLVIQGPEEANELLQDLSPSPETPTGQKVRIKLAQWLQGR